MFDVFWQCRLLFELECLYLAEGQHELGQAAPATPKSDLKQSSCNARRILTDVHHIGRQREALHPGPGDIRLQQRQQQALLEHELCGLSNAA